MKTRFSWCYLLFFLMSFPYTGFSQPEESKEGIISFSKKTHDFGKIAEYEGVVKVDFEFQNKGNAPLVLESVEASCGCTTPTWTADSVMPGETGFIQVAYDPNNRPGPFNKTVTVSSTGTPAVSVLSIEGMVVPAPKNLSDLYPYKIGGLQFRKRSLHFGNITNEKPVTKTIEAYNSTDRIIAFSGNSHGPKHITVTYNPQAINPGEVGMINVTYDAKAFGDLGYTSDNITLFTYELQDSVKQFNVFATVLDYFPPLKAEELASVPKIQVDKLIEDFGNTSMNAVLETAFVVTNQGKEPLELRKIKANCPCLEINYDKKVIQPGDTATIDVRFNVSPLPGTQQKRISIFSNDPTAHVQVLTLKAYVQD